jgi:hypothetical protein
MLSIQFPPPTFRIRQRERDGADEIFDNNRKRWLLLTPEEWVRQNFVAYLVKEKKIPASLIGLEKELKVGELRKRFDIVVFKNDGQPWLLVECKAMDVQLSERTITQTLSYLSGMACNYAVITNGQFTYGWNVTDGFSQLAVFPDY